MTEPRRPNWVHCALTGMHEGDPSKPVRRTWCGRTPAAIEFTFVDASHAILNGRSGSHTLLCVACAEAIREMLRASTYYPVPRKNVGRPRKSE